MPHLDLGGNQLTNLPAEIGQLSNLTHLELGGNQLAILPARNLAIDKFAPEFA
ncbi:MAG: leucine-rich repeat domain-containing protein [Lewinellaceae bacterium]|nr:leucine-rich repeat domain-containing protein [Lewinellaceae bacterium]